MKDLKMVVKMKPVDFSHILGKSKFGGLAELPKDIEHPKDNQGLDLPFLCQLNLSEFPNPIADQGMLYFFCTIDDDHGRTGAVVFSATTQDLLEKEARINDEYVSEYPLREYSLEFSLIEEADQETTEEKSTTQLLGKPFFLQADPTTGYNTFKDGRLLLQVKAEEFDRGEMFDEICGPDGFIYFSMESEALEARDFTRIHVESQNT